MPVGHELPSDAEALASQQIGHEKGRGQVHTMGLNGEYIQSVERDDRMDTVGGEPARRVPDALTITSFKL